MVIRPSVLVAAAGPWMLLGGAVVLSLTADPKWPLSLMLMVSWATAGTWCVMRSSRGRSLALLVALASVLLMWKTLLDVFLCLACLFGSCL
jgi:hypothetical protein